MKQFTGCCFKSFQSLSAQHIMDALVSLSDLHFLSLHIAGFS